MNLRPEEISSIIKEQIKNYENKVELTDTGSVLKVGDGIASVYGLENAMAGELLEFPGEVYGMALNLEEDMVGAVMLGDDQGIKEGDVVKRTGNVVSVPVGDALIGRVVNALGQPIDGKGPINTNKTRPVEEQKTAAALAELLTTKEAQLVRFEKRASLPCHIEAANDPRYTEHVSVGAKALLEQNAYACVQAQTAEGRYWNIGQAIGQAYLDGQLKDADGNELTWAQFLKLQMDTLRKAAE